MKKLSLCVILVCSFLIHAREGAERVLQLNSDYINMPVNYDEDDNTNIVIMIDGKGEFYFNLYLSESEPEFWVFLDVSKFKGKTATIISDRNDKSDALDRIYQSDEREYLDNVYKEKYRPQLHFSSMRGWINDPNGLIYYDGEYHLFYQHNPYGYYWGNMHWGHAVSTDLVHWKQLPEAIYQHEYGGIFSGSSVIDYKNTSGFKSGNNDVMVAIYTSFCEYENGTEACQNLAYSNDRGRTFTEYENNPVIGDRTKIIGTYNVRDPKVIWHEPTGKWVMILYERIGNSIFTSDNLKDWEYQSHTETFWECPELFELPVDGNQNNKKWVMYDVSGDYIIGDFDGKKFIKETGRFNYLQGKFFAAQTFANIPAEDGRRIQIGYAEIPGWVDIPEPEPPFNGMMSFPTELTLRNTANGVRMFNEPVKEIELLHAKSYKWNNLTVDQANDKLKEVNADLLHVKCEIRNINAIAYSIMFDDDVLYYTLKPNMFYFNAIDDKFEVNEEAESYKIKYLPELGSKTMQYEFIVDKTSLEVYVDNGRFTMIFPRILKPEKHGMKFGQGDGGQEISDIKINSLEVYELKSIWK